MKAIMLLGGITVAALLSAPPGPQCGVNSECIVISKPTDNATSGVRKPIVSVYRAGKKIPFKQAVSPTLGPLAVSYTLNKTDSTPEIILFAYK